MLHHLWTEHPDVLQEPAVLPLAEMRLVRVQMAQGRRLPPGGPEGRAGPDTG